VDEINAAFVPTSHSAELQGYIEGRRCGPEFLNPLFINVAIAQMNFGGELFPSAATISYLFPCGKVLRS